MSDVTPSSATSYDVLVVEDDRDVRVELAEALTTEAGLRVQTAADGNKRSQHYSTACTRA